MFRTFRASRLLRAIASATVFAMLTATAGCGSGMPATYPVRGKVVWKGGKPVMDGRIEFQSVADEKMKAVSEIGEDGTFSLVSHLGGKSAAGAVAGQHRVVVETSPVWNQPVLVVVLPQPFTVEPRANDFVIEIQKPRR